LEFQWRLKLHFGIPNQIFRNEAAIGVGIAGLTGMIPGDPNRQTVRDAPHFPPAAYAKLRQYRRFPGIVAGY
jgi:hypothetical protein